MPGLVVFSVLLLSLVAPGLQWEDKEDGQKKDCSEDVFCIPDSYDVSDRPDGKPLGVSATLNVRNIFQVSSVDQKISLETSLRLYWIESRLTLNTGAFKSHEPLPTDIARGNRSYLLIPDKKSIDKMWKPDLFLDESIEVRKPAFVYEPESIKLYTDGLVRFSKRINFDLGCNMDFRNYPVDLHFCPVKIESFGYQNKEVDLKWSKEDDQDYSYNTDIRLPQYSTCVLLVKEYQDSGYVLTYPSIVFVVVLRRELLTAVIDTYVPSLVFQLISYLSLYVPSPDNTNLVVRTSICMFVLLTQATMMNGARSEMPAIRYLTLLDYWFLGCIFYTFAVLIVIITSAAIKEKRPSWSSKLEKWSRILWPVLFVALFIPYVVIVLSATDNNKCKSEEKIQFNTSAVLH